MKEARLVWNGDVCPICGKSFSQHKFSDECLQVGMLKAKTDMLTDQAGRNTWYRIQVDVVMPALAEWWKANEATCKNKFQKSFVPSVLQFFSEKGFVSKKQLDVALSVIERANYGLSEQLKQEVSDKRGDLLAKYALDHYEYDELEWKDLRKKVRYYYKQGWLLQFEYFT